MYFIGCSDVFHMLLMISIKIAGRCLFIRLHRLIGSDALGIDFMCFQECPPLIWKKRL